MKPNKVHPLSWVDDKRLSWIPDLNQGLKLEPNNDSIKQELAKVLQLRKAQAVPKKVGDIVESQTRC